jgi:chemotaxis signal transduction protein
VRLAAGAYNVVEYLLSPATMNLPRTPVHCPGVMLWRERMIPVVDLAPVLAGRGGPAGGWSRAVVLAWQDAPGEALKHGALIVRAAPVEVFVADDMACPLPEQPAALRHFANSCFGHHDEAIAVLDVVRLFARPLAWVPAPHDGEATYVVGPVEPPAAASPGFLATDTSGTVPSARVSPAPQDGDASQTSVRAGGGPEAAVPSAPLREASETTTAGEDATVAPPRPAAAGLEAPIVPPSSNASDPVAGASGDDTVPPAEVAADAGSQHAVDAELRRASGSRAHEPVPIHTSGSTSEARKAFQRRHAPARGEPLMRRSRILRTALLGALSGTVFVLVVLATAMFLAPHERPTTRDAGLAPERTHAPLKDEAGSTVSVSRDIAPEKAGTISTPAAPARPPD